MKRRAVILVLTIVFTLLTLPFLAKPAHAQENWVGKNYGADNDDAKLNGSLSSNPYVANTSYASMMAISCGIIPWFGPDNCTNNQQVLSEMYKQSALANIGNGIAFIYKSPPADFGVWLADTGQSLGFIPKQAYAQGVGFSGLSPLLPIWKIFRNIAYLLLSVALIVIGFMVMMRKKIDPKTVVTVQNALPRVVISMILITFSYAIVGLMIDVMYILIVFINSLLRSNLTGASELLVNYVSGGFWALFGGVFGPVFKINPLAQLPGDAIRFFQNPSGLTTDIIMTTFGKLVTGAIFTITGVGPLVQFILGLAYLFAFIRILFMLVNSYVQVLLATIVAPLQILMDVFPGSNAFSSWFKNLIVNLITFPITVAMLMIGNVLSQNFESGKLWVPPLLPQPIGIGSTPVNIPGVGQVDLANFGGIGGLATSIISLGIIMTIPTVVKNLKEMLKAQPAVPAGAGTIFGPIGGAASTVMTTGYQFAMISQFLGLGKKAPGQEKSH
jgi:hypothetical protein